jgi:hypothetical protein
MVAAPVIPSAPTLIPSALTFIPSVARDLAGEWHEHRKEDPSLRSG